LEALFAALYRRYQALSEYTYTHMHTSSSNTKCIFSRATLSLCRIDIPTRIGGIKRLQRKLWCRIDWPCGWPLHSLSSRCVCIFSLKYLRAVAMFWTRVCVCFVRMCILHWTVRRTVVMHSQFFVFLSAGKYKAAVGSEQCIDACPSFTWSPQGSINLTDCTCNVGYTGPDGMYACMQLTTYVCVPGRRFLSILCIIQHIKTNARC